MRDIIVGICYDFDKTLSPRDMQEYGFIEKLGMTPNEFWGEVNELRTKYKADMATGYMYYMVKKYQEKNLTFTEKDLNEIGKHIELYDGVESWFKRINDFGKEHGVQVEHYIISSGTKEILEGTKIASEFKAIFASSFIFDENGKPVWPAQAINYTNKTQFMFRINKGILDVVDNSINDSMRQEERRIQFQDMIYIGDSSTDIPCMRLIQKSGGNAIGVYDKKNTNFKSMLDLLVNKRINYFVESDYSENSEIERVVKEIILGCKNRHTLENMSKVQQVKLLRLKAEAMKKAK